MLHQAHEELASARAEEGIGAALADAGCCSEANAREADPHGPELLSATKKDWKQRKALRQKGPSHGRIPESLPLLERMERKLPTKQERGSCNKRGLVVHPVFGQIKGVTGWDRFIQRELNAAASEWHLMAVTHNLRKLGRPAR
jgi:hypothetical protein